MATVSSTERVQADEVRTNLIAEQPAGRAAEQAAVHIRDVLAAISDAFTVYSRDWVVTFANEESARRLGGRPEQVVGKTLWELVPRVTGTPLEAELRRAMATRTVTRIEERIPGRNEWLEVIGYPLPDGGLAIYARDVTPRKVAEEVRARAAAADALRAEVGAVMAGRAEVGVMLSRCCEAVVRHLPTEATGIWLLDPSGRWLDLEASAGTATSLDRAGRRLALGAFEAGDDVVPLKVGDQMVGMLVTFGAPRSPDDTRVTLEWTADSIAHGIDRRRAEIELDQRAQNLARSNADLEQFAYVASHDLQEPLRIVASYNQLLARRYKGKLDSDADDFIGFSVDGINRMQRLIGDLLAYSRVGSDNRELAPVEAGPAASTAVDNLAEAIADTGAQVTHDPLPTVMGDDGQLVQLFQNLIGNAIKFHGPARPVVHVGARRDGRQWIFSVNDNGIGIEPQYFDRIFVIFQRLHSRDSYPGTGIGLALCKKIVEGHGGRIWVESAPDQGSTFFFVLGAP